MAARILQGHRLGDSDQAVKSKSKKVVGSAENLPITFSDPKIKSLHFVVFEGVGG